MDAASSGRRLVKWRVASHAIPIIRCSGMRLDQAPISEAEVIPTLVFDITTSSAKLGLRKSKLPHYPEVLPLRMLEKLQIRHINENFSL